MTPPPDDDFGRLLAECRAYLLAVAVARLPATLASKVGASDVVQDTLFAAYRHREQFRGHSLADLRAWLRGILLNTLATTHHRLTDPAWAVREPHASALDRVSAPTCPRPGPAAADDHARVAAAVHRLPPDGRAVLALRVEHALGFREIGERLGRSEEAARKLFARAVDDLRRTLPAD